MQCHREMSHPHLSSLAANSYSLINDAWLHLEIIWEIISMQDHKAVGKMFQRSRTDIMDPMHIVQQ